MLNVCYRHKTGGFSRNCSPSTGNYLFCQPFYGVYSRSCGSENPPPLDVPQAGGEQKDAESGQYGQVQSERHHVAAMDGSVEDVGPVMALFRKNVGLCFI
jgi:hypothetical protein